MAMTSASKVIWSPHSNEHRQQLLRINGRNHELALYDVVESKGKKLRYELVAKQGKFPDIRCFDWSPVEEDLIAIGQSSGDTLLLRIREKINASFTLSAKPQRACNSVAFNRDCLLATGFDKVRQDSALNIWDINQRLGSSDSSRSQPTRKISTETVASLKFFNDQPNLLATGMGNKQIRVFDLRESSGNPVLQAQTKCILGITIDKDQNYFASYSDEGLVSVWDRRLTRSSGGWTDPVLAFNRTSAEEQSRAYQITCLRYSTQKSGVLSVLKNSGALRVYETTKYPDSVDTLAPVGGTTTPATTASAAVRGSVSGGAKGGDSESSRTGRSHESIYVAKITDLAEPVVKQNASNGKQTVDRRICSFDWMYTGANGDGYAGDLKMVCLRYDGELDVFSLPGSVPTTAIGSRNTVVVTKGTELIMVPYPATTSKATSRRAASEAGAGKEGDGGIPAQTPGTEDPRIGYRRRTSEATEHETTYFQHQRSYHSLSQVVGSPPEHGTGSSGDRVRVDRQNSVVGGRDGGYMLPAADVLNNDICMVMKRRVERGYGMNPTKCISLVQDNEFLKEMWTWLQDAIHRADHVGMVAHSLDLNYVGVRQILKGDLESRYIKGKFRNPEHMAKEVNTACEELRKKLKKDDFIGTTNFHSRRSLALVVCGWHFNRSDLEDQLRDLEKKGEYAKAAGWALFHNDLPRCIKSLSLGGEYTKAIATAVAGYLSYTQSNPPSTGGSTWKDLCRSMAIDVGDPYLRAIYAYVSNGEWIDVLDDVGLPIKERLGIAIRFLGDEVLANYVEELTRRVVKEGDLEGIILTGVGETFVELLQNYVDRTSDVQTAAIVGSFAWPRYLADERVHGWVEAYRELLNGWGKWKARGRFDVARGHRGRRATGVNGMQAGIGPVGYMEVQRQIVVRCNTCDRTISSYNPLPPPSHSHPQPPSLRRSQSAQVSHQQTSSTTATLSQSLHSSQNLPGTNSSTITTVSTSTTTATSTTQPPPSLQSSTSTLSAAPPSSLLPNTKATLCPTCKKPLPRCAICLLHLGSVNYKVATRDGKSKDPRADYDRWFSWCLKCGHGVHVGHGREWFEGGGGAGSGGNGGGNGGGKRGERGGMGRRMCPVPECECFCAHF